MAPAYGATRRTRSANQLDLFGGIFIDRADTVAPVLSQPQQVNGEHGEEPVTRDDLSHWQAHRPQMVEELRRSNQLEQAISEAEARTADLLYELLSVQKVQYQEAWEQATLEWAFPPTGDPR